MKFVISVMCDTHDTPITRYYDVTFKIGVLSFSFSIPAWEMLALIAVLSGGGYKNIVIEDLFCPRLPNDKKDYFQITQQNLAIRSVPE